MFEKLPTPPELQLHGAAAWNALYLLYGPILVANEPDPEGWLAARRKHGTVARLPLGEEANDVYGRTWGRDRQGRSPFAVLGGPCDVGDDAMQERQKGLKDRPFWRLVIEKVPGTEFALTWITDDAKHRAWRHGTCMLELLVFIPRGSEAARVMAKWKPLSKRPSSARIPAAVHTQKLDYDRFIAARDKADMKAWRASRAA